MPNVSLSEESGGVNIMLRNCGGHWVEGWWCRERTTTGGQDSARQDSWLSEPLGHGA